MNDIETPGTLLANIPGILGYYPQESLVIVTLGAARNGKRALGPVLRLDLADLRYAFDVGDALEGANIDLAFAFVVSATADAELIDHLQSLLRALSGCGLLPLQQCWFCQSITSGEPFYRVPIVQDEASAGARCQRGIIPEISRSNSMHALLEAGELPMLSRQEVREYFAQRPAWANREWRRSKTATLQDRGEQLQTALHAGEEDIDAALDRLSMSIASHVESKETQAKILEEVGVWMATVSLRDAAVAAFLRDRDAGRLAALAIARCFDGDIRANALCMYAVCSMGTPASFRVPFALECAEEECPEHRLTHLLKLGYRRGESEMVIGAVIRGSHHTLSAFKRGARTV
ncbi:DUF4192 domain-containing protein [Corynebacterium gerontici]|uniref:DUF4192 domain-containing protein n=1 Tax=Corynebacterium gerontici TaxID=2079234 RepID=A0A3G6J6E2_9CORY|nr:DUF4192 domain-containing protein [Corynebacterium gerontici]AZA11584.1 hypothetical protein CGERO_06420 [Corynebacterium gerontici]